MGNDVPRSCANRMAIGAMMSVTEIEKPQIKKLRDSFADIARRSGNPHMIARDEYYEGLNSVDLVESDRDILDRLFIMLDRTGEERVNYKELIVGITPLISATTAAKLLFAFAMFDDEDAGRLKYNEARFVLLTLNAVSSYFGDPVLRTDQIDELLDEATHALEDPAEKSSGYIASADLCSFVTAHPLMTEFLEGRGSARYGNQA
mmetsp:Transcript_6203/g.8726  ORF Transcript_6203/g.8726 Transcript_6203/m.8726 type:complete len:205 (-) Transcript_6203:199-813(-)|eukprot:CAMPEP_0197301660 /NCGR_PEP_ID=MMETSP0890-20130614/50542_1 /TAXON_ID=44058 ORGANISM="Aureoumbra lagunensis, Strain CCMP1510" /NCGR_SAMPLE_ID=MMETSP0890 /ASSEMBLY_ACC=CAM_ASM_000533 /LENGTH=204 /DNA_ID=CAMNT_0042781023 /DNA_START=156 /DNA_END=770 /DNA_ORIENTATION=+